MKASPIVILVLASQVAHASGAVEKCRAAHADDPAAHVVCLEDALRDRDAAEPAEEIGLDQMKARARARGDGPKPVAIEIVSITYDGRGRGTFRIADGQVWRETEFPERRPRLSPSRHYTGRIERGTVGGYRLYVDGIRWMFKIERLE